MGKYLDGFFQKYYMEVLLAILQPNF